MADLLSPLSALVLRANVRAVAFMAGWRYETRRTHDPTLQGATGIEVWRGPSKLTGAPIVVIITGFKRASDNAKTGDMLQVWFLPQKEAPHKAAHSGLDASVCGMCKHRPSNGGGCYVTTYQGPRAVWQAWRDGRYPRIGPSQLPDLLTGASIRIGAWGDPVAAPLWLTRSIAQNGNTVTGYTHQWQLAPADPFKAHLMASVDTPEEARRAHALGWRTFRVHEGSASDAAEPDTHKEITCLADSEKRTCAACGLCNGGTRGANIRIKVHGSAPRIAAYRKQRLPR